MPTTSKLPAFAKPLLAKRAAGLMPVNDLLIACGWTAGRDTEWWPWRIVVPDDADPLHLDFGICRGLPCLVAGFHLEQVASVVANVLAFKPTRIMCLDMTTSGMITVYDAARV